MIEFLKVATLLLVLLNPFLMSIYLMELIQGLSLRVFAQVMVRACVISAIIFILFALFGDFIFEDIFHVRFASFLIFGGVVFLLIGLRFLFYGVEAMQTLRGEVQYVSGSTALPFMIGPGTVSAAVLTGTRLQPLPAIAVIVGVLTLTAVSVILLKQLHDRVKETKEGLVERYIEIVGRLTGLFTGTYAVEMIIKGIETWRAAG